LWLAAGIAAAVALSAAHRPAGFVFFDQISFAYALDEFDPGRHHPQPPGYPLFVLLGWMGRAVTGSAESGYWLAGCALLAGGAWFLARMAGGSFAAMLLLLHPTSLYSTLMNQVRTGGAFASAGTAYFCWRAWDPKSSPRWLYAAALFLGIASALRPNVLVDFAPLLLVTAWRRRSPPRELLIAASALVLPVAIWAAIAIRATTGGFSYWIVLDAYAKAQFGTSLAYGGNGQSALWMAGLAAAFNLYGVLAWIWALLWAIRRGIDAPPWLFALAWFLPGFLFSALVHVAQPDHVLTTIPVLCTLGGCVLGKAPRWLAIPLAIAISVAMFLTPLPGEFGADDIRALDQETQAALGQVKDRRSRVLVYEHPVSWRVLSYYLPEGEVIALPRTLEEGPPVAWRRSQARELPVAGSGVIQVPGDGRPVVWLGGPGPWKLAPPSFPAR
jgi:hypothetical protein